MPNRTTSPALIAHRTQQAELARLWHSLSPLSQNGFQSLALQTKPPRKNGRPRTNAFLLFAQLNTALANSGQPPQLEPPSQPVYPPTLPLHMTLRSQISGPQFSLTLDTVPYPNSVVVYACAPSLARTNPHTNTSLKIIGALPSLVSGGTDIACLYTSAFRAPQEGEKIAIKFMGVSPSGFATDKTFLESITAPAAPWEQT